MVTFSTKYLAKFAASRSISLPMKTAVPSNENCYLKRIKAASDSAAFRSLVALCNLTHKFLQGLGYKVLYAGLPGEALQIAKQYTGHIDLLLTDVVMPGMNGLALAQQLRPLYADMRVLHVSGFTDHTLEQDVLDTNDAFLGKPFLLRELATKIRELFRKPKAASYTEKKQNRAS